MEHLTFTMTFLMLEPKEAAKLQPHALGIFSGNSRAIDLGGGPIKVHFTNCQHTNPDNTDRVNVTLKGFIAAEQ